jgi:chitinase
MRKMACNPKRSSGRRIFPLLWSLAAVISSPGADKIVCGYYPSFMRGALPAESIQFANLTHVAHAFAWPETDGTLSMDADFLYPRLIDEAHRAGRKVLVSLGGWGQSSGFSPMAADPSARAAFVQNVVRFCGANGYDGVDIDWESPANPEDKNHLTQLIEALRTGLDASGRDLLLTLAIPAGDWGGQWFDYTAMQDHVDWFGCMTYDFFGSWVSRAGHNSPLYPPSTNDNGSIHSSVLYLTSTRSLPRGKVLIGIPFYGRGCNATGYGAPNTGGDIEYGYSEIVPKIGKGWATRWDKAAKVPFLLDDAFTRYISYDDTASVRLKCEYALNGELSGVMIWAMGQDVIGGRQPLMETVGSAMRAGSGTAAEPNPIRFTLFNAYPNPFNARTTLAFTLNGPEHARLEVFNLAGELIRVLLDEGLAAGRHTVPFDGEGLPSGTYLYHLTTPSFSKAGRMALLK